MRYSYLIPCAALLFLAGCSKPEAAAPAAAAPEKKGVGSIERLDPALDALLAKDAIIEKVGGGFSFTEGPMWHPSDNTVWFSDVTGNLLRSITPAGEVKVLIEKAGGESTAPPGGYVGPNGMVIDKDGSVLLCQHTNRQIARVDKDLKQTTFINKFEGKRLNSPNDLVFKGDGSLYFTDPPYGLPKMDDDPAKELKFNGVYRYANGKLTAIIKDLNFPNGIALSPDDKILYVSVSDEKNRHWMRYDVKADGTVENGKVFADVTNDPEKGVPDGMKVDSRGNLWASGPGGILIFSPEGKRIGTIKTPEGAANCGWGDDGKSLYITATTGVYRVKTLVAGEKALY